MSRKYRYMLFAGVFLLTIAGFLIQSYLLMGSLLTVSFLIGMLAERIDNLPDEPFKQYNDKFHAHK